MINVPMFRGDDGLVHYYAFGVMRTACGTETSVPVALRNHSLRNAAPTCLLCVMIHPTQTQVR